MDDEADRKNRARPFLLAANKGTEAITRSDGVVFVRHDVAERAILAALDVAPKRIAELEGVVEELWRLGLIIESAVRNVDPSKSAWVDNLLAKARASQQ